VVEPGSDSVHFEDILAGFVQKSLVSPIIADANVRYHLLETTRAYAFGKLNEADETDMIAERHARHYTDLLHFAFLRLPGRFRSKKPLCCSRFSSNSLPKLTGKIF
jgi:predicted ATPase